jgi:hypothetical protein
MVTLAVFEAGQPLALVTVRVRSTVPEAPAVYVMFWVLVAEVIVPFTIDHAYVVAPAGPDAEFPVELAQTCAGVGVIAGADGLALIVTLTVVVSEQLDELVTVRVRSTVPEAPAV